MITIYGIQSPHVARLRAALVQKGLEFQHVSVNLGQKSEEFKRLSPAETIPILQDGEVIIGDSFAAIDYLDRKYPDTYQMLGTTIEDRAKIGTVWWAVDRISRMLTPFYIEKFGLAERLKEHGAAHRALVYDDQQKKDLQKEISYRLQRLQEYKEDRLFFTGKFSAADAALLALLKNLQWFGFEIGGWDAWIQEVLLDEKIAAMFPPHDEKGVKEI